MLAALTFLTILPLGSRARAPGRGALVAFPLVGLLLGAVWWATGWAAFRLFGPLPAAAAVILVDLVLTGGLHLDAVADLADGWAARKPPAGTLAVMRDPAIGAVGAAALGAVLLLRWSLLAVAITTRHWWVLLVPPTLGRAAMVWALTPRSPAAPASLTAPMLSAGWDVAAGAGAIAVAVAVAAARLRGAAAVVLAAGAAAAAVPWARRRLGGMSGDVAGAVGMAAEILALACVTANLKLWSG